MGQEAACTVRYGKQRSAGKALLETSEVIFRGEFRVSIPFSTVKSAKAVDGELRLQTSNGPVVFELGAAAEKWCEKILHPKTRMEKLGVKPDEVVSLIGEFDAEFLAELEARTRKVNKAKVMTTSEAIFFGVESCKELAQVARLAKSAQSAAALWIVYPKGQKGITENDVLAAGRKAGLKDVKVVGFSGTHTALKFVTPLNRR